MSEVTPFHWKDYKISKDKYHRILCIALQPCQNLGMILETMQVFQKLKLSKKQKIFS